jgi:hypothetical protein
MVAKMDININPKCVEATVGDATFGDGIMGMISFL